MAKKLILTGGGTAGHVTPNLALITRLKDEWEIEYIGSKQGIEKELITAAGIQYHAISSGKLRRYFDLQNFRDPFKVCKGVLQSYLLFKKLKPNVLFSKGGFVSVPVVVGARLAGVPVLIHESDLTPGLANKIAARFATKIFTTFSETNRFFPPQKTVHVGSPIRDNVLNGNRQKGLDFLGFHSQRPVLTVIGGSLGSRRLNEAIRASLSVWLEQFQVAHICGRGNVEEKYEKKPGYRQLEYVNDEMGDVLAATDIVISRAGANSIFEFLALKIPMLLIPLPKSASRGDQLENAEAFARNGFAEVLHEEALTEQSLKKAIRKLWEKRAEYQKAMENRAPHNSLETIVEAIRAYEK